MSQDFNEVFNGTLGTCPVCGQEQLLLVRVNLSTQGGGLRARATEYVDCGCGKRPREQPNDEG